MRFPTLLVAALLISLEAVSCFRLALINDIHLNLTYAEPCSLPLCKDMGMYFNDAPIELLDTILNDISVNYN